MDSLKAFCLHLTESKPELDAVTLSWIRNCFNYMVSWNSAFAKLVVEIDYPISKWEVPSIEEFLSYSLRISDLLNSLKYCVFHLGHARFSISHSLSLIETSVPSAIERLRSTEFKSFEVNLKSEEDFKQENYSEKDLIIHQALAEMKKNVKQENYSEKDLIIHQALVEIKKNSELVFGIILSCLSGNMKRYTRLVGSEGSTARSGLLEEFKKINEAKACLLAAMETGNYSKNNDGDVKKLETELEEIQKQLDDIGSKADDLFSETLAASNEVRDVFVHRNL